MTIVLSCGHTVEDFCDEHIVSVKEFSREWNRAVAYKSVCKQCYTMYKNEDAILYTEEAEMEWLNGTD